ncbi:MAG: hypothetical protein KatS3mg103_0520 [Phycisphaerales bacterium]|nr:MAG: hypothetical protein KatS3mg103_0520 [Phycisphaerales bacterium]
MLSRHGIRITTLCALTGSAMGQAQIAYDVDENPCDFQLQYSTAPSVGVSGLAAVVLGTHEMALFDKAGNKIDSRDWFFELPDPTYPFAPGNDGASILRSLVFPRAEYDPLTGRLWMFYSEAFNVAPESGPDCTPILHIAVDKGVGNFHPNPGLLEGLGEDHWWYYTGNASDMTEGNGGVAFKLNSSSVDPFREPVFPQIPVGSHAPLQDTALLASYGFDERAIVAAMSSRLACTQDGIDAYEQYIYLIPRSNNDFSTNDEWLIDGVRADEGSFVCIQMRDAPLIEDDSVFGYVVQEPYEQYANATFLVSTAGSQPGESQTAIRVKGLFFNDGGTPEDPSDDQWEVRQSLEQDASAPQGWRLFDSDIGDPLLNFYRPTADDYPDAPAFSPTVEGDFFTSAVLTKDASGTPRIFAVHAALADDGTGNPSDRWIVQWYVIDPDLTDFHSAPILSEDWRPTVIARGRIEESQGDCYHPVLGVNDDGLMTIEYTYSSGSDDQEIRRARFNSSYAITSTQSLAPAPTLPDQGFLNSRWALYADLQFDPSAGPGLCNWLWSTHTLVDGDATMATYIRDVWLYRQNQAGLCFQTDLNQSGFTDLIDMMMYTDYYMRGDERADTDYDGYVDAIDMANYLNAYRAATGP